MVSNEPSHIRKLTWHLLLGVKYHTTLGNQPCSALQLLKMSSKAAGAQFTKIFWSVFCLAELHKNASEPIKQLEQLEGEFAINL